MKFERGSRGDRTRRPASGAATAVRASHTRGRGPSRGRSGHTRSSLTARRLPERGRTRPPLERGRTEAHGRVSGGAVLKFRCAARGTGERGCFGFSVPREGGDAGREAARPRGGDRRGRAIAHGDPGVRPPAHPRARRRDRRERRVHGARGGRRRRRAGARQAQRRAKRRD